MKTYHYNDYENRGASFDLKLNARSWKEVSCKLGLSISTVRNHGSIGEFNSKLKGIIAKPHGSRAIQNYKFEKGKEIFVNNIQELKDLVKEKAFNFFKE